MKKQSRKQIPVKRVNGARGRGGRSLMGRDSIRLVLIVLLALACGIVIGVFASDVIGFLMEIGKMVPEKILDSLTDIAVPFVLRQLKRVLGVEGTMNKTRNRG